MNPRHCLPSLTQPTRHAVGTLWWQALGFPSGVPFGGIQMDRRLAQPPANALNRRNDVTTRTPNRAHRRRKSGMITKPKRAGLLGQAPFGLVILGRIRRILRGSAVALNFRQISQNSLGNNHWIVPFLDIRAATPLEEFPVSIRQFQKFNENFL